MRIDEEIWDNPSGIMIKLAILKYVPAFVLLKINSQIGSPKARKVDSNKDENKRLDFIEKLIFDFITFVFSNVFLSILFDCSLIEGIIVTASDPMRVEGIINIGNVIPIIIPNSDRASIFENPKDCKRIGIIIAMIDDMRDETVRIAVIGELVFNKFLNSGLGLARFPPVLKYIIITMIDEITQAALSDSAVLFVAERFIMLVLNNIIKNIILITCSMNSVMLIVKNFCCPQSAPLSTS